MGFKPRKQEQYKKLYPDALHSDYACDKCGWVGSPKFSEGHKEPGQNFACGSQESADFYRNERFEWMAIWCAKNGLQLDLDGEIGLGHKCVGILAKGIYPDYEWFDEYTFPRQDNNGDVWTPAGAYHKHPCVAVLGRGDAAERQLYDWLKWFAANDFTVEFAVRGDFRVINPLEFAKGKHLYARMVKK